MATQKPEREKLDSDGADESQSDRPAGETRLVRQLKNRHIAMIRYANLSSTLINYRRLRL